MFLKKGRTKQLVTCIIEIMKLLLPQPNKLAQYNADE